MNFKLKTLVAVLALSAAAATSANAAVTGAASTGSSVIFSAWDANGSYSLDLGSYLNTFIGVDTATTAASGSSYSGAVNANGTLFDIKLTGFNLTSGSWNLAASDTVGRYRMLLSQAGTSMSPTNSQVKNGANNVGIYESLGAAASTSTGTLAASTDAWYANGAGWGDAQAGVGIGGTSNALGSTSNLYVAWMNSLTSAKAGSTAGFTQLTANGLNVVAFTHAVGADTYLTIAQAPVAAVPEADTSAMMLAGLGLMGFIARRRNRKQA